MFSFFFRRDITYPRGFQGFFCLQVLQVLWKNYKNIGAVLDNEENVI